MKEFAVGWVGMLERCYIYLKRFGRAQAAQALCGLGSHAFIVTLVKQLSGSMHDTLHFINQSRGSELHVVRLVTYSHWLNLVVRSGREVGNGRHDPAVRLQSCKRSDPWCSNPSQAL